jgi:hypothetical protein
LISCVSAASEGGLGYFAYFNNSILVSTNSLNDLQVLVSINVNEITCLNLVISACAAKFSTLFLMLIYLPGMAFPHTSYNVNEPPEPRMQALVAVLSCSNMLE